MASWCCVCHRKLKADYIYFKGRKVHKKCYKHAKTDGRTTRNTDYYGSRNPNAKLTKKNVIAIRDYHEQGATASSLAKTFGVTRGHIWNILARRTWKHI